MSRTPTRGITRIDVIVIISVIVLLASIFYLYRAFFMDRVFTDTYDSFCKGRIHAYDPALALYRNDYGGKYPPYSGVKFLAILYRTGYLTEKDYFICPAREDARWIETGNDKTAYKFAKPAKGEDYSPDWDPKFEPWEITYAGRRNDPKDEGGKFCLPDGAFDPTPIVSDGTLNHYGENKAEYAPHGGNRHEIIVLLSDGKIVTLREIAVGTKDKDPDTGMDLECLSNK
jgi:hypothetical protein